jgi:hypothetical protein
MCFVDTDDHSKRLATICISWKALEIKILLTHQSAPDRDGQAIPDGQLVWHDVAMQPTTPDLSERCPITLCGFSSKFTLLISTCLRLSAFSGSLTLPQWALELRGTSNDGEQDAASSWCFEVGFLEYPSHWTDTAVGVFVPIRLIRQLLVEYLVISLKISKRIPTVQDAAKGDRSESSIGGTADDFLLRFGLKVRLPALAGCLTRLMKHFVGKEVGSLIILYRDLFEGFAEDLGHIYREIRERGAVQDVEVQDGTISMKGGLRRKTRRFPAWWKKREVSMLQFVSYKWQLQHSTPTGIVTHCCLDHVEAILPSGKRGFILILDKTRGPKKTHEQEYKAASERECRQWLKAFRDLLAQQKRKANEEKQRPLAAGGDYFLQERNPHQVHKVTRPPLGQSAPAVAAPAATTTTKPARWSAFVFGATLDVIIAIIAIVSIGSIFRLMQLW